MAMHGAPCTAVCTSCAWLGAIVSGIMLRPRTHRAFIRVRGEIMGPGKDEIVGTSQSVLIMINPGWRGWRAVAAISDVHQRALQAQIIEPPVDGARATRSPLTRAPAPAGTGTPSG
eukprot:COSAG01_NODE_411_length_17360_cov_11.401852_20_plen_116_part_00